MKKMVRFCALLLTLSIVLALLPVNVFAATKVSAVTITGLDEPVLDGTADYEVNVSSTPANAIDAYRVDWCVYQSNGEAVLLEEGHQFAVGDIVYAAIQLYAADNYTFGVEGDYYSGAVNMLNYDTSYPARVERENLLVLFSKDFYIVTETTGEEITAVAVSDLDAPVVGEKPDFDVTVTTEPADAIMEYEVVWALYVEQTDVTLVLDENHVFAKGESIVALIHAIPKEGYIFGDPLDVYKGTVSSPYMEEKVLHEVNADGSMYIYGGMWTLERDVVGGFVDVEKNDWYADAVLWAVENGVTTGVDETHFAPEEGCTRAQAVTFLWRAAGMPEPTMTECAFEDVDENWYYYNAVLWAVENGITNGYDATHFAPDETCTRAHIVTFLYRACKGNVGPGATNPFVDVSAGEWYTDAVIWAAEMGVTTGVDETHFEPESTCTRSQIVTFIYRAVAK